MVIDLPNGLTPLSLPTPHPNQREDQDHRKMGQLESMTFVGGGNHCPPVG